MTNYRGKKYTINIKNKWTNSSRILTMKADGDVQKLHKYVYYKHTTNLEDIISIVDGQRNTVFTLRTGFRRGK